MQPKIKKGDKKISKRKETEKAKQLVYGSSFKSEETLTVVAPIFLSVKMGLLHYHGQKEKSQKVNVLCPTIIKEYNSHMIRVDIHDQLTTIYEIYQKSRS